MLFIAAAIAVSEPLPPRPASAVAQATVSIRIIRAVTLKLDGSTNDEAPPARPTALTLADGTRQPAKLIEFQ